VKTIRTRVLTARLGIRTVGSVAGNRLGCGLRCGLSLLNILVALVVSVAGILLVGVFSWKKVSIEHLARVKGYKP